MVLIGFPFSSADCLIGSPLTPHRADPQVVTGLEEFLTKAAAASEQPKTPGPDAPASAAAHDTYEGLGLDPDRVLHWRRCQWPAQESAVAYSAALAAATNGGILRLHGAGAGDSGAGAYEPEPRGHCVRTLIYRALP